MIKSTVGWLFSGLIFDAWAIAVQYNAVQCNAVQYNAVQYNAMFPDLEGDGESIQLEVGRRSGPRLRHHLHHGRHAGVHLGVRLANRHLHAFKTLADHPPLPSKDTADVGPENVAREPFNV